MSITPKNWGNFQQYKDRKPQWIKLHRDLLDDYDFARLPVESRALAPMLWLLASEYDNGEIDATLEEIAFRLRMAKAELCEAIHPLVEACFFIISGDLQDSTKPDETVQKCTKAYLEKERETQVKTETESHSARSPAFERFKKSYPSRGAASNPWKPAHDLFCKFVKQNVDPEWLIMSAEIYKTRCDDLKITGSEKVAQAKTWLHQERFRDYFDGIEAEASRRKAMDDEMRAKGYEWKDEKWQKAEAA